MIRGYGQNKRQREDEQARKRQDKERRRLEKRDGMQREVPIVEGTQALDSPSVEEIMRTLGGGGGGEDRSAAALPSRLFVGGLSDDVSEAELRTVFGQHGLVADCIVMRDRNTRMSRGFGFVTMADRKDGARAVAALHGTELMGRSLVINVATSRAR
jgi:RNA recognition motif-containing protein